MGRPRSLVYKNLSLYNKNHSEKVKMYCGVEITALYLVKEIIYKIFVNLLAYTIIHIIFVV